VQITANQFVELIIAPSASEAALKVTAAKQNVRVLTVAAVQRAQPVRLQARQRRPAGAVAGCVERAGESAQGRQQDPATADQLTDLLFALARREIREIQRHRVLQERPDSGVGAGQMSRVDSTRIASIKAQNAGLSLKDSVVSSDAFFPFRDGIDVLAQAGAKAVIQPGGSMRDEEVIAAADDNGLAMVFTGFRHFRH